jgi:hypothetical protein
LQIKDERGFVIVASDTDTVDYIQCARLLAKSIRNWSTNSKICLVTDKTVEYDEFDYVSMFPYGDQSPGQDWKLNNDWQVWWASPFRQTIKLEADMLITSSIDHWWTMFEKRDLVISTGCRDFYNNVSSSRDYRKLFDANNLPDVYNAVTYWRVCELSKKFFELVRHIFENWDSFKGLLKFPDNAATTDVVYAIAAQIIGPELVTLPFATYPRIVHMKRNIIPLRNSSWTDELIWEYNNHVLKIGTIAQHGAFHYHDKTWRPY